MANSGRLASPAGGFMSPVRAALSLFQPDVHPGRCWAFPGSQGHALIKLAGKIIPTAVTMEHISEKVSPSGSISSAPKEFSVHVRIFRISVQRGGGEKGGQEAGAGSELCG